MDYEEDSVDKGGRPEFEITAEVCKDAKSLAAQGLTLKQIAISLGIHYATLNEKRKEYSEFSEAIEQGQAEGIKIATNALFDRVKEKDLGAIKYYLNNRDSENWKDRQIIEANANVGLIEGKLDPIATKEAIEEEERKAQMEKQAYESSLTD